MLTADTAPGTTWVADSGASHHEYNDPNSFISLKKLSADARITVKLGDESLVTVVHYGGVRLQGAELTDSMDLP